MATKYTTTAQGGDKEIIQQATQKGNRTICLPIDGSSHSETTLAWVKSKLLQPEDALVFLNVRVPAIQHYTKEYLEQTKASSHQLLKKYAAEFANPTTCIALQGDPRTELCREIELIKPDIVVVGTRGTGVHESPLGSTAAFLAQNSKYPVLIAHPQPHLPTLDE
jgi:nucleotide-binding universal stress UspA family protein